MRHGHDHSHRRTCGERCFALAVLFCSGFSVFLAVVLPLGSSCAWIYSIIYYTEEKNLVDATFDTTCVINATNRGVGNACSLRVLFNDSTEQATFSYPEKGTAWDARKYCSRFLLGQTYPCYFDTRPDASPRISMDEPDLIKANVFIGLMTVCQGAMAILVVVALQQRRAERYSDMGRAPAWQEAENKYPDQWDTKHEHMLSLAEDELVSLALEKVHEQLLTIEDFENIEPFLTVGLPGMTMFNASLRSVEKDKVDAIVLSDETEAQLPKSMLMRPLASVFAQMLEANQEVAREEFSEEEAEYLREFILFLGDAERIKADPDCDETRLVVLHRIAARFQRMALDVTRISHFQDRFRPLLAQILNDARVLERRGGNSGSGSGSDSGEASGSRSGGDSRSRASRSRMSEASGSGVVSGAASAEL